MSSGVLFSHKFEVLNIFSCRQYTKMSNEQLNVLIRDIQADEKQIRLLHVLGQQFELLINRGRVDLNCLFASLQAEGLVSEEEVDGLKSTFALEAVRLLVYREGTN